MTESSECLKPTIESSFKFNIFDTIFVLLSLIAIIVDVITDIFLSIEYLYLGYNVWAAITIFLIFVPSFIVQFFSLKWHIADQASSYYQWFIHFLSLGIFCRIISILKLGCQARRSNDANDFKKLNAAQNDLSLLHLFETFLESAPQLVVQLYIMAMLQEFRFFTCLSAAASIFSLALSLVSYSRAQRKLRQNKATLGWPGIILQAIWRLGMLTARISAFVILLLAFKAWFLLFFVIHWLIMFLWIIYQNTDLCDEAWEERCYNAVAAVILCFCFFNLKDGRSRWRLLSFHTFVVLQNLTCLTMFLMFYNEADSQLGVIAFVNILGGTVIGTLAMMSYYRFFHPSGKILFCAESCHVPTTQDQNFAQRSLKRPCNSNTLKYSVAQTQGSPISNATLSESKLALSDSIVIVEESDMEEIVTLQSWIKEAANERRVLKKVKESCSGSPQTVDLYEGASSVLSAHDYENLAAVNIARAAGIRSWRGYCDIDACVHDDSIGRSSSTTTTSQDYLDSIAEDYADCKTQLGLHTILEESESNCSDRGQPNNNACALVATIDQIRGATPILEDRQSRVRRTFSLLRERFESSREPPPPTAPWAATMCSPQPPLFHTSSSQEISENLADRDEKQSRVRRTFSLLRERFEINRESPTTTQGSQNSSSPRFISVKDMRLFFLKQVLTPPKLSSLRRKMVVSPTQ